VLLAGIVVWLLAVIALMSGIVIYSRTDRAQSADVIIVLGAGLQGDNSPGPALRRRTAQALQLWQNRLAPQIICAGGYGYQRDRSEADACADLLIAQGVRAEVIRYEDASRSTEENAIETAAIMQAEGWHSAVLVSDGYHLLRATLIFNQAGIVNYPSPAVDPPPGNHLASLLREVLAFHWLLFKTLLGLDVTYVPVL
jgi:uncharacterized SAM-binding protein YcdF (DUF218 family)